MKRKKTTRGQAAKRRPARAAGRGSGARSKVDPGSAGVLRRRLGQKTRELHEALEQQAAAAGVLKAISSSTDLPAVLSMLVQSAAKLCRADRAAIRLLRDGALHHLASFGFSAQQRDFMSKTPVPAKPDRGMIAGRVLLKGKIVQVEDTKADPDFRITVGPAFADVRTVLGVPLQRGDALIGVFIFSRKTVERFTERQIALISGFADQAVIAIENARLLNELRQSLDQQTATSEVLGVISSSPGELEPVFQTMLENATRICGATIGILFRYEEGAYSAVSLLGVSPAYAEYLNRGPIRAGPATGLGRVASSKQTVHIADTQSEQAYADRDPFRVATAELGGARSLLNVPMLKDGELIGAIGVYRQEVRPFTDKQVELVTNFAAQAVIAIENARLLNELRQRTGDLTESLDQQTATSEVLRVVSSSPGELRPVFDAALANAIRLCEASFGVLVLSEGDAFRVSAMHNVPSAFGELRQRDPTFRPSPLNPVARAAATREVVHIANLADDIAYKERDPAAVLFVEMAGTRTLLVVPMLKDAELIGAIAIYRKEARPFTDKHIELVQNFAAQAVIAIENARLLSELRQSLERQTATADVLRVISSSPGDLEPVFRVMLENATQICQATFGVLSLREGPGLRVVAMHNAPPAYAELRRREPTWMMTGPMGRIAGQALATRQCVQVPDLAAYGNDDPLIRDFSMTTGARTLILVPLLKDGELIGTSAIYRQEVRPFTDKQVELLTNFAAQAVIAIENARLLNELRQRTADLSKSLDDLRTAQDRLVQTEKLASLGQLTAGIAHEIKNPLNFVNNFSSLSAELIDELQEELADLNIGDKKRGEIADLAVTLKGNLDRIAQHGKRADAIVKNMLLHSREGSGERRPVDVNALVEESLNLAYHGARAEKQGFNITLERSFDAAAGEADIYPQEVTRVLLNIIGNGFYAAHKRKAQADGAPFEPTVTASTKNLGDRVEIKIRDNGIGIPPEVKEKMFNPFFTTKPAGEGTGLGLSISHDIVVKQHSGTIAVDTEPGQFTEFTIVLPRKSASLGKPVEIA